MFNNVYTGDGRNGNLSKEQFATIVEGALVYDEGKDDYYVFGGMRQEVQLQFGYHYVCIPLVNRSILICTIKAAG